MLTEDYTSDIVDNIRNNEAKAMLRPAYPEPRAALRLPNALPCTPAQCGAAQQPGGKGGKGEKVNDRPDD